LTLNWTWRNKLALTLALVGVMMTYFAARKAQLAAEDAARLARIAALQARADSLATERAALVQRLEQLSSDYKGDPVRLHVLTIRWRRYADSVRAAQSVAAVPETVTVHDSTTTPVTPHGPDPSTLLGLADSTIRACTVTLGTCEQRVVAESTRADNAEQRVTIYKAMVDTLSHPLRKPLWYRATVKVAEVLVWIRLGRALR